ncbi:MAG TPA: hypothetical protein PLP71_11135 [Syntrophomonadaceae bacterium]|nr:hypothetical protein [Syntrophomonadaceae bacterium]HQD91550.1 hypothetical protein [Syntrophomonadaceae bacterium]
MKRPVYFVTRQHKSNYQNLLQHLGEEKTDSLVAAAYILGAIGTIDDNFGRIEEIEQNLTDEGFNWDNLIQAMSNDTVDHALTKLAANLAANKPANVSEVFSPLNDEYQAVAYQALLIVFPSFSKDWERRFEFADQH